MFERRLCALVVMPAWLGSHNRERLSETECIVTMLIQLPKLMKDAQANVGSAEMLSNPNAKLERTKDRLARLLLRFAPDDMIIDVLHRGTKKYAETAPSELIM